MKYNWDDKVLFGGNFSTAIETVADWQEEFAYSVYRQVKGRLGKLASYAEVFKARIGRCIGWSEKHHPDYLELSVSFLVDGKTEVIPLPGTSVSIRYAIHNVTPRDIAESFVRRVRTELPVVLRERTGKIEKTAELVEAL